MPFAVLCHSYRGEKTQRGLWPGREMRLGHLFPFSARCPASSLPSWAPREASGRQSPGGASTKPRLGGLLAENCHCCSQRALILRYALVEMAAGHLGSSSGTHCWAQASWEAARGAGSGGVGVGGRRLLAVCQFLGVPGRLERGLVQLRNCLTFKMPSPITLSIPDSADLNQKQACLPSM